MFTEVIENISSIDATAWDACAGTAHPFTRHAFLSALEESGCVGQKTGWLPQHIVVYSGTKKQNIVGIMPFYLKDHSYGEYVFDWAWAEAYNRAGLKYYPKLLCAIPFTPVNGARLIVKPGAYDSQEIRQVLLDKVFKLADDLNVSSIHWLFTTEQDNSFLSHAEITRRSGSQFHWRNKNYESFNDFLTDMSHKKRKNIRRERRRITDAGIKYIAISNDQIDAQHTDEMFNFYTRTIQRYGAQQYLNREFFERITSDMPESVLFLFAKCENVFLAGGLFYIGDNALYGR